MTIWQSTLYLATLIVATSSIRATDRPNILWISSEDNGPQLGCYGDAYAVSPNLDSFASKGMLYSRASSTAPVCAPARTTIISGLYPPSSGAEHMRSMVQLPQTFRMFPYYLKEQGYHCSNPGKKDYNLEELPNTWDSVKKTKGKRSWQARSSDQPFFAVYNIGITHESKIRNPIADYDLIHDPAGAPVPAYHPDTPEVRRDWAQYYSRITMMDRAFGNVLVDLENDGLSDNTIVFYWGDHGSGMPRSKRWPYNSGLNVPLIIYFPKKWQHLAPEKYQPGGTSDRMVGFVDFAPTMLSLCGIEPKPWMQGHAFAGEFRAPARPYSFGFRGRMDERIDLVRTVMDQRYVYLRQYMPHRIYGQYVQYMFQTNTTKIWHQMHASGELNEAQSHFWKEKPAEELYDLQTDPDEVNNLANSPEHGEILTRLRSAHQTWAKQIRDLGFLPEAELHTRSQGTPPYEMGLDKTRYDFDTIFAAANLATSRNPTDLPAIVKLMDSEDSAVRYWGATGLLIHKQAGVDAGLSALVAALSDNSPSVTIVAAEALGKYSHKNNSQQALEVLLKYADHHQSNSYYSIAAANALDYLELKAAPYLEQIKALPKAPKNKTRVNEYTGTVLSKTIADIE